MTGLKPGAFLDIWEGEQVAAAAFLGEEKGRLRILTAAGRELRIPESRVAGTGSRSMSPADLGAIARALGEHEAELRAEARSVDVQALWEVLADEGGVYELEDLAELALGLRDPRSRGVVLRRLVEDTLYFTRKRMSFTPRSREELGESVRRREREQERERAREEFVAAARAYLASGSDAPPELPPGSERFLVSLRDVAVRGIESERIKDAESLATAIGVGGRGALPVVAFELLVRLKQFRRDENLLLEKHGIALEFPAEVLAEAERIAAQGLPEEPWRRDLRSLACFAVDDAETTEIDDAISLEETGSGSYRFGVHIADPTPFVLHDSLLDRDARARATTHYLPEGRLLMLPPAIAEGVASLHAGKDRDALSFLIELDARGQVLASEIVQSRIRVSRRLTYELCDRLIALGGGAPRVDEPLDGFVAPEVGPEEASALRAALDPAEGPEPASGSWDLERAARALGCAARLARSLLERRVEAGALILKGPDLDVKVVDGEVRLRRLEPWTPSWVLVSEAMILANRIAASWLSERRIPAIYRRQAPPDQKIVVPRHYDAAAAAVARRQLKRTEIGLTPAPHAGLGVSAYVQITSPLRRYQDLCGHRQLGAALRGETPPYDTEALWRVAATSDEAERSAREIERGNREYWLLRHLESLAPDTPLDAVVTRPEERRTLVELCDYVYVTVLSPRPGHKPGRKIRVVVDAVNPRAGRLVVRELS